MRLGRRPHSPDALARCPAHRFGAALPPATLDRSHINFTPELYGNDTYPNCTAVAIANAARGIAALNGYDLVVDPTKPLVFYGDCIGNPPNLETTDGAVFQDVLDRMSGSGYDIGPQRLVGRYGSVDRTSVTALANAVNRLGPLPLGITLFDRDMQGVGTLWQAPADISGAQVGGHELILWDYDGLGDTGTIRLGTWGVWQVATWVWLLDRLDEAHALVFRQLARADGTFYDGVTGDGLVAEL